MTRAPASARYCHGCGAPNASAGAGACGYCGGPLVPSGTPDPRASVRCPKCAHLVAQGASFCSNCGAEAATGASSSALRCPACPEITLRGWGLSPTPEQPQGRRVEGCPQCGGVWVPSATLEAMVAAAAAQAVPEAGGAIHRRALATGTAQRVVYRPCPVCSTSMLRRNFARISGVIVDECRTDGTFFDAGELEDVLAFVRSGGLAKARQKDMEERARTARPAPATPTLTGSTAAGWHDHHGWDRDGDLVSAFLRWAGRWMTGRFD